MKQCISDAEELDWESFWQEKLKAKGDRQKDWNKAAPNFGKSARRDGYHTHLVERINPQADETILDLGCGDGNISVPLAKRAKFVTGVDSAEMMLEKFGMKALKENVVNYETILEDLTKVTKDNIGNHDIVVASRSSTYLLIWESIPMWRILISAIHGNTPALMKPLKAENGDWILLEIMKY